ncbi:RNA 2',3'-cyclic phosphodiesterase [Mariniplasma anaerobium]|uniref:RNA 2',3'-cyclic phosphodiesterase n=1 Tax=Mariniplasma anaerobium TaxID=2735436 RepID=A0A7U9XVV3_9MOLU|nr:RNA 2',3'-cyclic phosphodiesterase [Mariniplasma anaerobium]BCR36775.1 RNA 2',3'-cyclic phosphodiesterase [Mariniplasma anaerobium]
MRIFVGVKIPEDIRNSLDDEADKVLRLTETYNKSLNENYHLTIKFIGEMKISEIVALDQILAKRLKDIKAFDVYLKDIGYFEKNNEYTLWIGVQKGSDYLDKIHHIVDFESHELFGIERNKYEPHVTLARKVHLDNVQNLKMSKTKSYKLKVEEITIYYSHRVNDLLTYTPLSKIKLK